MKGYWKYVRFDDGVISFCKADGPIPHKDLGREGHDPVSAGAIIVEKDEIVIVGKRSNSLDMEVDIDADVLFFQSFFQRPVNIS